MNQAPANKKSHPLLLALCLIIGACLGYGVPRLLTEKETTLGSLPSLPDGPQSLGEEAGEVVDLRSGFREYPIGEVEKNHMRIAAVWLPPVTMEGQDPISGQDVIHLEADVASTRGNPNGFGLGEWVPYLTVNYEIAKADGTVVKKGEFQAMVAADGPHYGATLQMPGPGLYRVKYSLKPPSFKGFGRHCDKLTGVAGWWKPFEVNFDWKYQRP
jgi:periplasmic iron binding protein